MLVNLLDTANVSYEELEYETLKTISEYSTIVQSSNFLNFDWSAEKQLYPRSLNYFDTRFQGSNLIERFLFIKYYFSNINSISIVQTQSPNAIVFDRLKIEMQFRYYATNFSIPRAKIYVNEKIISTTESLVIGVYLSVEELRRLLESKPSNLVLVVHTNRKTTNELLMEAFDLVQNDYESIMARIDTYNSSMIICINRTEKCSSRSLGNRFISLIKSLYTVRYHDLKDIIHTENEELRFEKIKQKQRDVYLSSCKVAQKNNLVVLPDILNFEFQVPALLKFKMSNAGTVEECRTAYSNLDSVRTFLDTINSSKYNKITSMIKISKHIVKNSKKVSRAYYKLLEIVSAINIKKYVTNIHSHHSCEAPGMFILAFGDYCRRHNLSYRWSATTLHLDIGLPDDYGIIKRNKHKWKFYDIRDLTYLREIYGTNFNVYTADVGLPDPTFGNKEDQLKELQLHAYIKGIACLSINGILITKMFAPCLSPICQFIFRHAYKSFREVLVIKPSLNPSSHEFYLCCIGMKYKESYSRVLEYSTQDITGSDNIIGAEAMIGVMENTSRWITNSLMIYQLSPTDLRSYIEKFRNRYNK